ncbi:hypothetical protein WG909_13100 [Peptostreptococcaceae bacterium AGR-M142]
MASDLYKKLCKEAQNNKLNLTKKNFKTIRDMFKELSKELEIKAVKAKRKSLSERFLLDYKKSIDRSLKIVREELYKNNKKIIIESAKYANEVQLSFFNTINNQFDLGLDKTFNVVFSKVPEDAIKEIIRGEMYKDRKGLSLRIWTDTNNMSKDIDYIISKGIAEKKDVYSLSKDLEMYVNPEAKKTFEYNKVYPGTRKQIDFNAQRLARTSINHAFFLSNIRSCKRNPFLEGMKWELSMSHHERQVIKFGPDECDDYTEQNEYNMGRGVFPLSELPLPHPQCLCSQYAVLSKSLEDIGVDLGKWVRGENNPSLDNWYKKYYLDFMR